MKTALLKVEKIKKKYRDKEIIKGISFEIFPGEIVSLLGANGAGKTTTFYMTIGLIYPDEGSIFFQNYDVTKLPIHKRALLGIGYLAQEPSLFRSLSVEENILAILETMPLTIHQKKERLAELLQELNLEKLAKNKAFTLSGGERRRLEITRTLVKSPSLLLLDEPFANIDPLAIADLKKMMRFLKGKGISILITDHNAREICSVVDRSYLMKEGSILASGNLEEILQDQEARSSYFGEDFRI